MRRNLFAEGMLGLGLCLFFYAIEGCTPMALVGAVCIGVGWGLIMWRAK